ncbi:hypothetical protein AALO_G00042890 [Alosa alosa]|uniref:Ig-like domain-containing protein n=1 Tax=Alosa alosa TaxID=278164 RepID=A0AAV6HBY9_9TELE|nr:cell surface glycoprotein CD200 receptor 1-B [Alosa alosa]KAG5283512.1 hypothetical protein AALO_G00042890 [Alosa alosa]
MTRCTVMWLRIVTFLTGLLIGCLANQSTVQTFVGMNVLLPCSCGENRGRIVWETKKKTETLVCHEYTADKDSAGDPQFTNRTHLFRSETGNCSLQLFGVTVADEGQYTCSTFKPYRTHQTINLKVMANYAASCTNKSSSGELVCEASGGYPKGKIYWQRDSQRIPSVPFSSHRDASSLLYNLTSNLKESRGYAECVLEIPGQTITINCSEITISPSTGEHNVTIGVPIGVIFILIAALAVCVLHVYCRKRKTMEGTGGAGSGNGNETDGTEESPLQEVEGKDPVQTEFTNERET